MKFLICYSNAIEARCSDPVPPLGGSTVDIDGIDDLLALQKKLGHPLIVHDSKYVAFWAEYLDPPDPEEDIHYHRVSELPDGWREMRWLEVYNGYRE